MATKALRRTIDRLRQALVPSDLTDEQLLQRFIGEHNESAFAGLVRRHGPMILGVCRRVLGNLHDSEDVFQATFLVLAQKARSVVNRESLASWLYKVAYRIALKVRARNARRRRKEKQVNAMPHFPTRPPVLHDWEVLLDEELHRLPEKYRVPLILCDLEGRTGKEAERRLRVAPGTLSSRLTTARRMLAERLTRRGLTFSAGALAAAISESASAALPPGLLGKTVTGAKLVAAGQLAAISSSITVLLKIGAKAMFLAKLKATLAAVTVLAFVGGGIVYSGGSGQPQPKNELEALRRENELLKVNLRVTLEKIESLEKQLTAFKGQKKRSVPYVEQVGSLDTIEGAAIRALEEPLRQKAIAAENARVKSLLETNRTRQLEDAARLLRKLADEVVWQPSNQQLVRHVADVLEKMRAEKKPPGRQPH
jgi:RNA polymerase sigma factor (sigma-70 family)